MTEQSLEEILSLAAELSSVKQDTQNTNSLRRITNYAV